MLDGLQAEGEAAVLVHYTLAGEIQGLYHARLGLDGGKPLPMVLREQRVWGPRERLYERALPNLRTPPLARLVAHASIVDGIVKGLPHPQWPVDAWEALRRLALQLAEVASPA
jgi:DNA polymerase III subunit delta